MSLIPDCVKSESEKLTFVVFQT